MSSGFGKISVKQMATEKVKDPGKGQNPLFLVDQMAASLINLHRVAEPIGYYQSNLSNFRVATFNGMIKIFKQLPGEILGI